MSKSTAASTPAPISFSASQYFEGNDGKWSTFLVRAGTPEQSFRVLPSTVTSETFLPLKGACKGSNEAACSKSRGAENYQGVTNHGFQTENSSTWHEIGLYNTGIREELGYNATGLYGLDKLGLMVANSGGPTLENQVIAGVVNSRLWLGRLGMDVKPSNFSEYENPQRSLITTLKEEGYIPSLSYGYTAGAYYKTPSTYGSLTLGGYEQSRFVPNNVSFPFDANDSRKTSLNIEQIIVQNGSDTFSVIDEVTYALIDFGEPHLWLPVKSCDRLASAFNLTYDSDTDLYLVSPETHTRLIQQNPNITFGLGNTANPAERVNIVLPYRAFDQQATYPIYENETNYFPIRRAYNNTQYTLGRTFLQEAYITIDYERGNFSVHQALFPATNEKQVIVPIAGVQTNQPARPFVLKTGAIVGISIGVAILVSILLCLLLWLIRRRTRSEEPCPEISEAWSPELPDQSKCETDGAAFYEKDGQPFAEMEAHVFPELCGSGSRPGDMASQDSGSVLNTIFELHEAGSSEERMVEGPDVVKT